MNRELVDIRNEIDHVLAALATVSVALEADSSLGDVADNIGVTLLYAAIVPLRNAADRLGQIQVQP